MKGVLDMNQLEKIHERKWDNLIILDACRYDYFEREYPNFLDGELEKVTSPASCTIDWLKRTWDGYYDLTYVSGFPSVNSKGIPRLGYRASDHFSRIIDAWDFGWDERLGTITPWNINKAVLNKTNRTNLIIHYMQPHQPYIGKTKITVQIGKPEPTPAASGFVRTSTRIRNMLKKDKTLNLESAYRENLILVLEWVAELVPLLKGEIIVTSDHGENLGPGGPVHPCGDKSSILREVPWLERVSI